jgi:membrane associated rhomboid family serine protease
VGSFPVYASTVLAALHGATMVLTALALGFRAEGLLQSLQFSSRAVLDHFAIWQIVTYAFVHPPEILFLLEIYLLVVFGREIESFLGRSAFLKLYATLLVLPPLVLSVAGLAGFSSIYSGSSALHFGVFVAFATLYPSAEIFFRIQARWMALALVSISALQCLAYSRTAGLTVLLLDAATAFLATMFFVHGWSFSIPSFRGHPHLRVFEADKKREEPLASIDSILEKISRSGMASLSAKERGRLEQARAALLEKDENH